MRFSSAGRRLAVAAFLTASFSAQAQPFSIGPLKIGMTNAEVASRMSLRDCRPDGDRMVCLGTIKTKTLDDDVTLTFDRRSKRLSKAEMRLVDWTSDDARLPALASELNFVPCKAGSKSREPDWYLKDECIEPPDEIRRIEWDPGRTLFRKTIVRSIRVTVEHKPGIYQNFVKMKAAEKSRIAKRDRDLQAAKQFSQGK